MFNCSGCACCCKRIPNGIKNAELLFGNDERLYFPYEWDEDGVCEKLVDDKCSVYEDRPLICDIERGAEVMGFDKEVFYEENYISCNKMMDEDGIDVKFRVGKRNDNE